MRAKRTDSNQKRIVELLRKAGCCVFVTSALGDGFPDLVCGWRGRTFLLEIKDGSKPPSARKLTEDERKFHDSWTGGPIEIIASEADLVKLGLIENDH